MLEVLWPVIFMQSSTELPAFHASCAALRRKSWKIRPMYFGFCPHDFPQTEHFLSTFNLVHGHTFLLRVAESLDSVFVVFNFPAFPLQEFLCLLLIGFPGGLADLLSA